LSEPLSAGMLDLLRRPSPCFVATVMPDGSPQLTQTWVTNDGEHVVINIVEGKRRETSRDPRVVAVNVADPDDVARFYAIRGRVIAITTEAVPRASTSFHGNISADRIPTFAACPRRG
jgi:Pyridoxamine 5'-phosphate oxidase